MRERPLRVHSDGGVGRPEGNDASERAASAGKLVMLLYFGNTEIGVWVPMFAIQVWWTGRIIYIGLLYANFSLYYSLPA